MKKTLFISSILGIISLILPTYFLTELKQYESPLFPIIATSVKAISIWSIFLLAISGFIISLFSKIDTSDHSAIIGLPLISLGNVLNEIGVTTPPKA